MYWFDENEPVRGSSRQVNFYADTTEDVADLPTSTAKGKVYEGNEVCAEEVGIGSLCMTINPSNVYILNSENTWVKL